MSMSTDADPGSVVGRHPFAAEVGFGQIVAVDPRTTPGETYAYHVTVGRFTSYACTFAEAVEVAEHLIGHVRYHDGGII